LSTSVAFRATPLLNSFTPTRGPVGAVVTPSSVLTASSPIPTVILLPPWRCRESGIYAEGHRNKFHF
jgi:hypothetical protein